MRGIDYSGDARMPFGVRKGEKTEFIGCIQLGNSWPTFAYSFMGYKYYRK